MRHPKYSHAFEVVAELPQPLEALQKLAYNFRWTWRHESRDLFREADKALWEEVGHNPVQLLSRLPAERLQKLAGDKVFLAKLSLAERDLDEYLAAPTWFDRSASEQKGRFQVAYFCAEFGITEGLPIY